RRRGIAEGQAHGPCLGSRRRHGEAAEEPVAPVARGAHRAHQTPHAGLSRIRPLRRNARADGPSQRPMRTNQPRSNAMLFLVNIDVEMPAATPQEIKDDLRTRENARAMELIKAGKLRRIWRIVGQTANYGIWEADTLEELHANLGSLPMFPYF